MTREIDLDVSTPEELPAVLERAADQYRETQTELQSAWQDNHAGKIWADYATILDRAANSCRKALEKRGL